jgi:hypothetical protein
MDERLMKGMGGEVETFIKDTEGKSFQCSCGNLIVIRDIMGYPHSNGLEDSFRGRWWAFVHCDKCSYDWSFWKVKKRLEEAKQ